MENDQLTRFINFVNSKSLSYWLRWIVVVAFAWYIIYLILNFTFVSIKVVKHDGITSNVSVYSSSQNQNEANVFIVGDIALIRRDTVSLRAATGSYQTNKSIPPLPLIGFGSVTINLYKDHDARKYSGDSLGCVAYDNTTDTALSYSCTKPELLVRYNRPASTELWQNTTVAQMTDGFPPIYSIKPFMNGVVGIKQHPDSDQNYRDLIFTYDSNGKRMAYDLPAEIDRNDVGNLNLRVDMASPESNKILIINSKTGDLYLGTLTDGTITYKNAKVSDRYDSAFDTLICALLNDTVYCHSGKGSADSDNERSESYQKAAPAETVEVIDFSKAKAESSIYKLPSDTVIENLYVTRSKHLYSSRLNEEGFQDISSIKLENGNANLQTFLTNVSTVSFGDGVLYLQNNGIYKIDDDKDESYLVFSSKNLNISNILPMGKNVFFTAFVNATKDRKVHTYKLLDTASEVENGKRLVDILPFYMGSEMISIDYVDTIVRVRVFAPFTVDRSRNVLLYDEGQYEANRTAIETRLNSLGITSDKYQIIYSK